MWVDPLSTQAVEAAEAGENCSDPGKEDKGAETSLVTVAGSMINLLVRGNHHNRITEPPERAL